MSWRTVQRAGTSQKHLHHEGHSSTAASLRSAVKSTGSPSRSTSLAAGSSARVFGARGSVFGRGEFLARAASLAPTAGFAVAASLALAASFVAAVDMMVGGTGGGGS